MDLLRHPLASLKTLVFAERMPESLSLLLLLLSCLGDGVAAAAAADVLDTFVVAADCQIVVDFPSPRQTCSYPFDENCSCGIAA